MSTAWRKEDKLVRHSWDLQGQGPGAWGSTDTRTAGRERGAAHVVPVPTPASGTFNHSVSDLRPITMHFLILGESEQFLCVWFPPQPCYERTF